MNFFKKIKELFYKPFTHNPEDFKLELEQSVGGGMVYFRYSANGGKNWKYVYWARKPFLGNIDYDWEWTRVSYLCDNLISTSFDYELNKFSSYQKILDYEKAQSEEFDKGNKEHRAWRKKYYDDKRKTIENINKKIGQ